MIQGNQVWRNALTQLAKQPLYVLEIPDFAITVTSFTLAQGNVATGGYGVYGYGLAGYGI